MPKKIPEISPPATAPPVIEPRVLTAEQLAAALQMTRRRVEDLTREGKIPCVRPSPKVIRFILDDVLAALKARK